MEESFLTDKIIEQYKHPKNFFKPDSYTHSGFFVNQYCGDEITMFLSLDNGIIKIAHFTGAGCSLCIASASLLIDAIEGKTLDDIKNITVEKALALTGTKSGSKREMCALIGLKALQKAASMEVAEAK